MRLTGSILLALGVLLGVSVALGMAVGVTIPGVSWLVAVGLVKLTLIAAAGLMAAGAVLQRLAKRVEHRATLSSGDSDDAST
jgi:hypothetical protein